MRRNRESIPLGRRLETDDPHRINFYSYRRHDPQSQIHITMMNNKFLLVLAIATISIRMIASFAPSSPRPRLLTSSLPFHRRQSSSLFAAASDNYYSRSTRKFFEQHQRNPYYDLNTRTSCRFSVLGRIRSSRIQLDLSSPYVADQHCNKFGTTTTSDQINDDHKPFAWARLIELFRKPSATDQQYDTNANNFIPSDHPNLALFRRSIRAQKSYEEHKQYLAMYWKTPYDYMIIRKFGADFGFTKVVLSRDDSSQDNSIIDQSEDESTITSNQHMYQASTSLSQASKYAIDHKITYLSLVLNEFPYDVEEGIEHWCLWKIGGSSITEGIVSDELVWAVRELECLQPDESSGSWCIYKGSDATAANCNGTSFLDGSNVTYARQVGKSRPMSIEDTLYWVNPPHLQSMPEIHHAHILVLRSCESRDDADGEIGPPPV